MLPRSAKRRRVTIIRAKECVIRAFQTWRSTELHRPAEITSSPAPVAQLQSQQTTTMEMERLAVAIPRQERIHILNKDSLLKALENLVLYYEQRIDPYFLPENNEQFLQYIPFSSLDHGNVTLLNPGFLGRLEHVSQQSQIAEPDYQQMLNDDIMGNLDINILVRLLCEFLKSRCLFNDTNTCTDAREFTSQITEKCVMILKVATGLFCLMWKELAEVNCRSFNQDLKNYCFAVSARQHIENLLEAMHSISNVRWPTTHICDVYQMFVLYEAIDDVLPALQNLCWGSSRVMYPNASDRTFQQMRVNFQVMFSGIKSFIDTDLNGPQNAETYDTHSVTIFLLGCMKLFHLYSGVLKHFSFADDGSNLLENLISHWGQRLREHSVLYTDGRKYMFPLNNLKFFAEEIRTSLQALLRGSEDFDMLENMLTSMISECTSEYLEEYWQPILEYLKPKRWPLRAPWTRFNFKFKEICDCQRTLVLHVKLKEVLREKIRGCVTPSYDQFLEEVKKKPIVVRKLWEASSGKYMTTEELMDIVNNLFES